jgi:molybdenum cofactor cytidylyltransferase
LPNAAPTEAAPRAPRIGCIVLAAGRSRRYGRTRINKLLARVGDRCVVQCVLDTALASPARPIVVVTGHQHRRVERALAARERRWKYAFNPRHRHGMASSLQTGLRALPDDIDGAVICLGDMPGVSSRTIAALIAAFAIGDDAVVPRVGDRRGNPVLLGRGLFARIGKLSGGEGARRLLGASNKIRSIEAGRESLHDIDTRRDWRRYRSQIRSRRKR